MGIRKSHVEKIVNARREYHVANKKGTERQRARAQAVIEAVLRNASPEECNAADRRRDDGRPW